ncbi:MAG TPA: protein kinase [Polyangiaceae bacterium]
MSAEVEPAAGSEATRGVGKLLAGRYRLQRVLGEGGMAVVYEGEHVALGKRVAVKLVQSLFVNDDEVVHRFEREARSASAVESEHIVHVFDVGADADLGLFLVMELLKGEDLSTVLSKRGRLEPVFAAGLVKQASLGLEKAHAAGIVHRDLKPANMFLVERDDGTTLVKLVDFGIAKIVRDAEDARFARKGITRRGTAIGTPQYMSPEQAQALDTVDHRTDVFSLGAVLFESIAGQQYMPERPTYEQTILQLVSTRAPRLRSIVPEIPAALDDLVADMLEHDLDRRVRDMRTVRERLEAVYPELAGAAAKLKSLPPPSAASFERYVVHGSGAPLHPTVSGTSQAIIVPRTRKPLLYVAGFAIAVGAVVGVTMMWSSHDDRPLPPAPATVEPARASVPPVPLSSIAPATAVLSAPVASTLVPSAVVGTAPVAAATVNAASQSPSPAPAAGHKPPSAHPKDQVGAAGISSQF